MQVWRAELLHTVCVCIQTIQFLIYWCQISLLVCRTLLQKNLFQVHISFSDQCRFLTQSLKQLDYLMTCNRRAPVRFFSHSHEKWKQWFNQFKVYTNGKTSDLGPSAWAILKTESNLTGIFLFKMQPIVSLLVVLEKSWADYQCRLATLSIELLFE